MGERGAGTGKRAGGVRDIPGDVLPAGEGRAKRGKVRLSKGVPFELLKKATTFHQNTLLSCELSDNVLISEYSCAKVFIGNRLSKGTPFATVLECDNKFFSIDRIG